MLHIPEWFSMPVPKPRDFYELQAVVAVAHERHERSLKRHKSLRIKWRAAKGSKV